MASSSSYLGYLPPVLWSADTDDKSLPLGEMLCIFEKLLTGIDDGEIVAGVASEDEPERGGKAYASLRQTIEESVRLFQPWSVPAKPGDIDAGTDAVAAGAAGIRGSAAFDWLAQWVALRQSPSWDEYQRRKALSEIVQVYAKRGTKAGLNKLIELYARSPLRTRIVIDDASKVLFTRPSPGTIAPIHTLVSQLPLIAPLAIAMGPDGYLYVPDGGNNQLDFPDLRIQLPKVWRVSPWGQVDYDAGGPRPMGDPEMNLTGLKAVAVDRQRAFGVYAAANTGATFRLFRFSSTDFCADVQPLATGVSLHRPKEPVAIIATQDNRVLILDRGGAGGCRIIDVKLQGDPPVFDGAEPHALPQIVEPLSMVQRKDGSVVIGDAGDQTKAVPAKLWRLQPTGDFTIQPLYDEPDLRENSLIAPSGIVEDDNGDLLVVDIGLKPYSPGNSAFDALIARQAAVYRLRKGRDSSEATWDVQRITETHQLVYPRGMTRGSDGTLYICDSGLPDIRSVYLSRVWRSLPLAFTVIIHFEGGPKPNPEDATARRRLFGSVTEVIEDERPVQSYWKLQSWKDAG